LVITKSLLSVIWLSAWVTVVADAVTVEVASVVALAAAVVVEVVEAVVSV
jgi:hypothetical protein